MLTLIIALSMASSSNAPVEAASPQKPASNKLVCKSFAKTQSRVGRNRVCRTQAEWDQASRDGAIEFDNFKLRGMGNEKPIGPSF